ncbi:uncharacterized protein M6B38_177770 [Iris pallida]|uniref:Uncharacterized protein n=1 Tax=Iris pallida TaxID=29817 RepID=A0AAX6EP88_IRIPA|nr:uncharacterized protein M6B38_177770 [Iris pallida]
MGCVFSIADDDDENAVRSPPLTLCRQRKQLILSAADCRFSLAAAHAAYARSLAAAGDALRRFADENLVSVPSPPPSPVVRLPSSDGKAKKPSSGSGSGTSLSHSPSLDSHIHFESESEPEAEDSPPLPPKEDSSPKPPSPNYNFMRSSSSLIPTVVYEDPYYSSYGFPMNPPEAENLGPREPPPMPEGASAWDFFDPFANYDQYLPDNYYYSRERSSSSTSPHSSEVREKEGIPDLEDDLEPEVKERASREGSSKMAPPPPEEEVGISEEKKSESGSSRSKEEGEGGDRKGGNVVLEVEVEREEETSLTTQESGPSDVNLAAVRGTRDVMEVVAEIRDLFRAAGDCGEEVSRILEYGKLNYRSMSRISRVISSRILEPMGLSMLTSSRLSLKLSRHSASRNKDIHVNTRKDNDTKFGSLSSTLEKLYVWEKKLYKEVKVLG